MSEQSVRQYQPHQQRVLDEQSELTNKVSKLVTFIKSPTFPNVVSIYEQERLIRQAGYMQSYLDVLNERILNF